MENGGDAKHALVQDLFATSVAVVLGMSPTSVGKAVGWLDRISISTQKTASQH